MLVIQGSNQLGNVLHVITGPETTLFTDVHGASIMDITAVLGAMTQDKPVFLSLTCCQHEPVTEQMAKGAGMHVIGSFNTASSIVEATDSNVPVGAPAVGGGSSNNSQQSQPPVQQPGQKHTLRIERCSYCKKELELLPIPGFKICTQCAQIEIGRTKHVKGKVHDDDDVDRKK